MNNSNEINKIENLEVFRGEVSSAESIENTVPETYVESNPQTPKEDAAGTTFVEDPVLQTTPVVDFSVGFPLFKKPAVNPNMKINKSNLWSYNLIKKMQLKKTA